MGDQELEQLAPHGELSTIEAVCAALDGAGYSARDVAQVTGAGQSTIAKWRRKPDYKAEVAKYREGHVDVADALINLARTKLLDAGLQARETLLEMLGATNSDGDPLWSFRLEAARVLANLAFGKLVLQPGADEEGGGGRGPQTAILQVFSPGGGTLDQIVEHVPGRAQKREE